jgi:hypothetical protein
MFHRDQDANHFLERDRQDAAVQQPVPDAQPIAAGFAADVNTGAEWIWRAIGPGGVDQKPLSLVRFVIFDGADSGLVYSSLSRLSRFDDFSPQFRQVTV